MLVITIVSLTPLGTYKLGQQEAYAYNKTDLFLRISAAIMYGVTTVQAGITNSSIGDAIESKETEIQSLVDNYVEYMMEPYQKLKLGMITDRADLIPEVDKETYLQQFENIPEFDNLTDTQKDYAWEESREILLDGIVTPREILEGTGIAYIYENVIKIAIEDLKENITEGEIQEPSIYQQWENFKESPTSTEDYEYQAIINTEGNNYIFFSHEPFYIYDAISYWRLKTNPISDIKKVLIDSNGDYVGYVYIGEYWNLINHSVLENNHDIYADNNFNTIYQNKTTQDIYTQGEFEDDVNEIEEIPVFNSPLNPNFDRTLDPNPFNPPDTTETPDASISVEYNPDTGDTNISQLSDSLGLLGDTYLEGSNQITGEIEQSNSLLDSIKNILSKIRDNTETGEVANPGIDTDMQNIIDNKINITALKQSMERLQNIPTEKGEPPVIYINLHELLNAGVSHISPGTGNPFNNENSIFIDFGYLDTEDITFLDYTLIDYFRFLIGMGMISITALHIWGRIFPSKVVS